MPLIDDNDNQYMPHAYRLLDTEQHTWTSSDWKESERQETSSSSRQANKALQLVKWSYVYLYQLPDYVPSHHDGVENER